MAVVGLAVHIEQSGGESAGERGVDEHGTVYVDPDTGAHYFWGAVCEVSVGGCTVAGVLGVSVWDIRV